MKKNTIIFLITALISFSCQEFLNVVPNELISEEDVYGNIKNADAALANLYNALPNDGFPEPELGAGTDECKHHWENPPILKYNLGAWGPTDNPYDNWTARYRNIRAANIFLKNIEKTPIPGDLASYYTPRIPRYVAEARFLRAMFYFELFKRYGAVPLTHEVMDPADIAGSQVFRNSVEEVVAFISSECDAAAASLPLSYSETPEELGRITKGAALALKARTLLYAASPLFNGNPLYANVKNSDGKALFNATYDKEKWKKAADAAKAVIDLGVYKLYSPTPENPVNNYAQVFYTREYNETILPYTFADNNTFESKYLPNGQPYKGSGKMSVTQEMVDAYETASGYPITDPASGYTATGFWNGQMWDGLKQANVSNISNMYKNRDPRFYASIFFQYSVWRTAVITRPVKLAWFGANGGNLSDGWPKNGTNCESGYNWRKWCSPNVDRNANTGNAARNYPIIRLAEMYLNYAEAMNEYLAAPDASVYAAVNTVRKRVSMPDLPVTATDAGKEGMRKRIQNERRVEFAFENHRFWDVRRWLIAKTVDNGPVHGLNARPTQAELEATGLPTTSEAAGVAVFYKVVVLQNRVFKDNHYLMPIPQSEIDRDPNLVQNYGW